VIYAKLAQHLGAKTATILYGLWFAALLLILLLFGGTPETTLRYLEL
jgi:hypothetical protein